MRYGITGAGGLIGTALQKRLRTEGYEVIPLPRQVTPDLLEGLDVLVHIRDERAIKFGSGL